MNNLENIPKKEFFTVPDGYFEALPSRIRARIAAPGETSFIARYKLQYVLPAILLVIAGIFWITPSRKLQDAETILATIETEQLVVYLNDSDITTDEFVEMIDLNAGDIERIEAAAYGSGLDAEDLDLYLNDLYRDSF